MIKVLSYLFCFFTLLATERDQVTPIKNLPGTMLCLTAGQPMIFDDNSPQNRSELSINRSFDTGYKESLPLYIKHLTAEHQRILESILSQTKVEKIGVFEHYVTSSTYFSDLFYLFEEITDGLTPDESIHVLDALVCIPVNNLKTFQYAFCELKQNVQHFYLKKKLLGHLMPLSSAELIKIVEFLKSVTIAFNLAILQPCTLENLSISLLQKRNPLGSPVEKIAFIGVLELIPYSLWPFLEKTIKNNPALFFYMTFAKFEQNLFNEIQFAKKKRDFDTDFLKKAIISNDNMAGFQAHIKRKLAFNYIRFYEDNIDCLYKHTRYCKILQQLAITLEQRASFEHFSILAENVIQNRIPIEEHNIFMNMQKTIIESIIHRCFITDPWENYAALLKIFMYDIGDLPLFICICKYGFYSNDSKLKLFLTLENISNLWNIYQESNQIVPKHFKDTLTHFLKSLEVYQKDYQENNLFQTYYLCLFRMR